MKKVSVIKVGGKEYPCYPTMGAMLRYKNETGQEVSEINGTVSQMATYLYCCVASACSREKKEFGLSLLEFADACDQEDLTRWAQSLNSDKTDDAENSKKKHPES